MRIDGSVAIVTGAASGACIRLDGALRMQPR
jgi:hypothetical protein